MEKNGEFKPERETKAQKEVQKVIEKTAEQVQLPNTVNVKQKVSPLNPD